MKRWSIPTYTIFHIERLRKPYGSTAVVVRSLIHHNQASLPQLAALETTAVNIPIKRERGRDSQLALFVSRSHDVRSIEHY
jgi:hypothetical protein